MAELVRPSKTRELLSQHGGVIFFVSDPETTSLPAIETLRGL
jgi:hypothetical protein